MHAKIVNGAVAEYPYGLNELRRDHPNTSFPEQASDELLASFDVYPVLPTEQPSHNVATQDVVKLAPIFEAGAWHQAWEVVTISEEAQQVRTAQKSEEIRARRNALLAQCDWTQLPDSPVNVEVWANYRTALREVPQQEGFPWNVEWPQEPTEGE